MFPVSGALDRLADRGKEHASREISRKTGAPEDVVRGGLDTAHKGIKEKKKASDIAKDVAKNVAKSAIKKKATTAITEASGLPAPLVEKGVEKGFELAEKAGEHAKKAVSELEEASLSQYPRKVQNFLNKHSNEVMSNIRVCRVPISSTLNKVLDVISLGSWSSAKKKQNYDNMFHLYLSFTLGGKRVILDKQSNITIALSNKECKDSMPVPSSGELTLKTFLERGRKRVGDAKFFPYNAMNNNCQDFLWNLLVANKLSTPALIKFIKQDIGELAKDVPGFTKKIADAATKASGLAERAYQNLTEKYEGVRD